MKHLYNYKQFINENKEQELEDLDFLKSLGMVDPAQYVIGTKQLGLVQSIIEEVMQSDEYQKLMEMGMTLDSGVQQLKNGTLVFTKPGATKRLGIFPNGIIRRMFLRGDRGIDSKIKTFDSSGVEMYLEAMQWILDNIDFNDTELLTKKSAMSKISAEQKKVELIKDIYREYEKLGMSRREAAVLAGNMYNLSDVKETLATVKRYVKRGIVPFMGYFSYYNPEDRIEVYSILSKPGVRWIPLRTAGTINVFLDSEMIWDNFDFDAYCKALATDGRYAFLKLSINFATQDQLEQYAPIFNNYEPTHGVKISTRVDPSMINK